MEKFCDFILFLKNELDKKETSKSLALAKELEKQMECCNKQIAVVWSSAKLL
jgi:hypothetical protein